MKRVGSDPIFHGSWRPPCQVQVLETCTDARTNSPASTSPVFRIRQAGGAGREGDEGPGAERFSPIFFGSCQDPLKFKQVKGSLSLQRSEIMHVSKQGDPANLGGLFVLVSIRTNLVPSKRVPSGYLAGCALFGWTLNAVPRYHQGVKPLLGKTPSGRRHCPGRRMGGLRGSQPLHEPSGTSSQLNQTSRFRVPMGRVPGRFLWSDPHIATVGQMLLEPFVLSCVRGLTYIEKH